MRRVTAIAVLILLTSLGGTAWGVCGDVDGDGHVNIADVVMLLVYLGYQEGFSPAPVNPAGADADGRAGLTIGDVVAVVDYVFMGQNSLNCSQAQVYGFAPSTTDTVFFPRMPSVPEGVDTVIMPIMTNFETGTQAVYLPFLKAGPGAANFSLRKLEWTTLSMNTLFRFGQNSIPPQDTITLEVISLQMPNAEFHGERTLGSLVYVRTAPGAGAIVPQLVTRSALLKPSVEKNGDLFLPVTQYYDFAFPPETLKVSLSSMSFDAVAGYPSADSFVVNFTSSGLPISFELTPSDPWITFVDTGAVGFRTPCNVVVKADATSTGIGNYNGQIQFTNLNPSAPTTVAAIDVSLAVRAPNLYPFGDLDCDGIVDISDLTKIIDYLYLSMSPLIPCQP